jgi:tetratricopeptide (TPR) repeat protein
MLTRKRAAIILGYYILSFILFGPLTVAAQVPPAKKDAQLARPAEKQAPAKSIDSIRPEAQSKSSENVSWRDILETNRRSNEKTLNTVILIVGALCALATIMGITIAVAGFVGIRRIGSLRKETRAMVREADQCLEAIKDKQKDIDAASKQIEEYLNRIKLYLDEARSKSEELTNIDIREQMTTAIKSEINDYAQTTEFASLLGIGLKADDYLIRGSNYFGNHRFEEAILAFKKAIELKPDYTKAWFNIGVAHGELGKQEEAVRDFEKVIELKPDSPQGWCNKGVALTKLNKHREALPFFDKAIELKPNYFLAWYNKGVSLEVLGKHEEAILAYDKAIEFNPDYAEAWSNKGVVLSLLGKHEEAIQAFNKAIEFKPAYPRAWCNKGAALSQIGKREEALQAFNKAIELDSDYPDAWFNRATEYSLLKNKPESLGSLAKAISLDPKNKDAAKNETDFRWLWDDPDFKAIVG